MVQVFYVKIEIVGERRMHYGPGWTVPENNDSKLQTRQDNDGKRVRETLYWDDQRQEYDLKRN
jgi:hypothetical protein